MTEETQDEHNARLERERQARVHQEAHEPTADWIDLRDPDEAERVADRYTPSITDDAAKAALKIYVQFAGKPHDAMRAAILSVLSGLTLGREQEAFRRGVAIGKAEAEVQAIDGQLLTSGPSHYEVWRDAHLLAVQWVGRAAPRPSLMEAAKWFHERLQQAPMQDAPDDGADPVDDLLSTYGDAELGKD